MGGIIDFWGSFDQNYENVIASAYSHLTVYPMVVQYLELDMFVDDVHSNSFVHHHFWSLPALGMPIRALFELILICPLVWVLYSHRDPYSWW